MKTPEFSYAPLPGMDPPTLCLAISTGEWSKERFGLYDNLEIGRLHGDKEALPGSLLIRDPRVSRRHCVISRRANGDCFIRDLSRNGTLLDGARLLPNVETPIQVGQVICIGNNVELRLEGDPAARRADSEIPRTATDLGARQVTVLVGDIRDYTKLVQSSASDALMASVHRVFNALEREVRRQGGTIKEHPGDAILAFWEQRSSPVTAVAACLAVLELDALVQRLADDPAVWDVPGHPLRMDWALATGEVVIESFGESGPVGLSMIGEAPVLAFRLEKAAGDETGPVIVCAETAKQAGLAFQFKDLGLLDLKGFEGGRQAFALMRPGDEGYPDLDATLEIP